MNHKHRRVLHAVFAHPINANLEPRQVYSMLEELGAEVTHGGHGHDIVKLNGQTHGFHEASHSLSKDDVMALRKFLQAAGINPTRDYPLDASAT